MTIEESIKNGVKSAIKEELGISNEVASISSQIMERICDAINANFKTRSKTVRNGVKMYTFNINDSFYYSGKPHRMSIAVEYYHFSDRSTYEDNKMLIDCDYATSITDGKNTNLLTIHCFGISGTVAVNSLCSSVWHEIEHIFQGAEGNESLTKYDSIYTKAAENLFSENKAMRYMSNIIYYSYPYEQDGYVNGLYAELMADDNPIPRWEDIKNSSAYIGILALKKSLRIVKKNKDRVANTVKFEFGMTVDTLIKKGEDAEKRFLTKVGKVLVKVRRDKEKQGLKLESTKPWIPTMFID